MSHRIKNFIIAYLLFLTSFSHADSGNFVGFGEDFIAFTSVQTNSTGYDRLLNIIPLRDDGELKIASTSKLEALNSEVLIKGRIIFLKSHANLYIYDLTDNYQLSLFKTISVPNSNSKMIDGEYYSLFLKGDKLYVFSGNKNEFINLSSQKSMWKLEIEKKQQQVPKRDHFGLGVPQAKSKKFNTSAYPRSSEGDWLNKYGTCIGYNSITYCLMYGKSTLGDKSGYLHFKDKYLISKKEFVDVIDILRVDSSYDTIH